MKRKFLLFFPVIFILAACHPTGQQNPAQVPTIPNSLIEILSTSFNGYSLTPTKNLFPTPSDTPIISEAVVLPSETISPIPTITEPFEVVFSPEFSQAYQPEFKVHYVAKIHEIEIPIDLGLMHSVITSSNNPIKEIHLSEDIVPVLAEMYLQACFARFKPPMTENWNLTYDQYLEMVKQGKGNIDFAVYDERKNELYPEVMTIDPRKGFSISLVDQPLPIKIDDSRSMYYGSNGMERLFIAERLDIYVKVLHDMETGSNFAPLPHDLFWGYVLGSIIGDPVYDIAATENRCLELRDVQKLCDFIDSSEAWKIFENNFRVVLDKIQSGLRGPIIEVVQ